jgi:predicted signal transduction protein with EAL and GGDEF domain
MKDPQNVIRVIDRLAERGIGLSLDDFGTGYSSLSYLKRFRVHKLKTYMTVFCGTVSGRFISNGPTIYGKVNAGVTFFRGPGRDH